MRTIANRDIAAHAIHRGYQNAQGYGAMSYTFEGYRSGYLNARLQDIFRDVQKRNNDRVPTIYSYGTPIAWYDAEHGVWVKPDVSYSVTTAKHQSSLSVLSYVSIPPDCGLDEYLRYVSGQMTYSRRAGIKPGPNFVLA